MKKETITIKYPCSDCIVQPCCSKVCIAYEDYREARDWADILIPADRTVIDITLTITTEKATENFHDMTEEELNDYKSQRRRTI